MSAKTGKQCQFGQDMRYLTIYIPLGIKKLGETKLKLILSESICKIITGKAFLT